MMSGFVVSGFIGSLATALKTNAQTALGFHLNLMLSTQLAWAAASIFLVEMVRDFYHVLGHSWAPLQKLHGWHHRAYKKDFSPISTEVYRKAQLYNDAPEAVFMVLVLATAAIAFRIPGLWIGALYGAGFLISAILRSRGLLTKTDLTHEPGPLTGTPSYWLVNRTYHWRHHFDDTNAYYAGFFPMSDKIMGTALSIKGKTVAVTGASGTMGRALIKALASQGAKPIALTTSTSTEILGAVRAITWRAGQESELKAALQKIDILIINHGVNVMGDCTPGAISRSIEINALSGWRLMETFLETVNDRTGRATKEVWVNTSEAEVNPAFSPLYEISKRLMGDLINVRRTDAPCIIRKLVLGPFKSELNPVGVMSADAIARIILFFAKRDIRNIIVTINPLTYLLFPLKELTQAIYFRFFLSQDLSKERSQNQQQTMHER